MTQEVLILALEALERSVATCFDQYAHQQVMSQPDHFMNQALTAIKEALAQPEPVKISHKHEWFRTGEMKIGQMRCISCGTWGQEETPQPEQEPVGKLQEPTAERSWFTIAELNAWADKNLAENPNWVMPKDEPEREWVGLTDEEIDQGLLRTKYAMQTAGAWRDGVEWAIKQLQERNT